MTVLSKIEFIREYSKLCYSPLLSEESAHFIEKIVRERLPARILEIGTATGYSGSLMLLSSPGARLNTIEYNEGIATIAKKHFKRLGLSGYVNIFMGDAKEIVPLLSGVYDFIFLDGPKGQYIDFLPYLLNLMSAGSVLVCDNVLFRGMVKRLPGKRHRQVTLARKLSEFIFTIRTHPNLDTEIYEIGDGISVSVMK